MIRVITWSKQAINYYLCHVACHWGLIAANARVSRPALNPPCHKKSTPAARQTTESDAVRTTLLPLFIYEWPLVCLGPAHSQHTATLRWRHNDHSGVSNHQPRGCLLNRLFRRKSKKTSKLRVTGLCVGNSPGTGEFPAQMASYAENVSIWWRHHGQLMAPLPQLTPTYTQLTHSHLYGPALTLPWVSIHWKISSRNSAVQSICSQCRDLLKPSVMWLPLGFEPRHYKCLKRGNAVSVYWYTSTWSNYDIH